MRLNLWDFGGQDIYHGSHALFLQGQIVFLILWTPELERGTDLPRRRTFVPSPPACLLARLSARLRRNGYFRADRTKPVRHARSTCCILPANSGRFYPFIGSEVSARPAWVWNLSRRPSKKPCATASIGAHLRLSAWAALGCVTGCANARRGPRARAAKRQHRLLERTEFDRLCDEAGGVSDKEALLDFLHHNGVIFYRPGLFGDRIILDQNWALEAIYAHLRPEEILPLLRGYGRFSRADLEALIWSGYTPEEQKVFPRHDGELRHLL